MIFKSKLKTTAELGLKSKCGKGLIESLIELIHIDFFLNNKI